MKHWMLTLSALALALTLAACSADVGDLRSDEATAKKLRQLETSERVEGQVVIANRASGTISVIDADTDVVVGTYDLPAEDGDATPEPMYVFHTPDPDRVWVGDRANNRVAVFDADSYAVVGTVPAGEGVFHMWADPEGRQLWVNNDIEKTTTVIDAENLSVITTVPTPADLVDMGGKPHDVIVGPHLNFAYVTVLGLPGESDYLVQFSCDSFAEVARAPVGKDPHLSLSAFHKWLYVPCQNSDVVLVFDRNSLQQETSIDVPGAHGAGMSADGRFFHVTNLPAGGVGALYTIATHGNRVVGDPVDSPYPVPHNIALSNDGTKLYVTHSGATADKVTVYRNVSTAGQPSMTYLTEITVGMNPFGLAYVP